MPVADLREIIAQIDDGADTDLLPTLTYLADQAPGSVTLLALHARVHERQQRWREAFSAWRSVLFLLPNSPAAYAGMQRALKYLTPARPTERRSASADAPAAAHASASPMPFPMPEVDDLDSLIAQLSSARIEPKPDLEFEPLPVAEEDDDEFVSETLARIYEAQSQYAEAARVYERLAVQQPARAAHFNRRAAELRHRATS